MKVTRLLGLAAVGALFIVAAPDQPAQALSLNNPAAAVSINDGSQQRLTTEVRWGGWHRHRRWHRHRCWRCRW